MFAVFAPAGLDRLELWLFNEGFNVLKIVLAALLLIRFLRWTTAKAPDWAEDPSDPQRKQQIHTLAAVLDSVGTALILLVAMATALREFGLDVRPTLAGAGILGITIGLGAQNVVRDVVSGALILLDNQYRIGDVIRSNGVTGMVETMTLRRTVIRDSDGAAHNIANGEMRIVANLTRTWSRVSLTIPVAANQEAARVLSTLESTARDLAANTAVAPALLEPPKVLGIEKLAGREIDILMQVRVQPGRQGDVGRAWRLLIKQAFERENIPFQDLRELALTSELENEDDQSRD